MIPAAFKHANIYQDHLNRPHEFNAVTKTNLYMQNGSHFEINERHL